MCLCMCVCVHTYTYIQISIALVNTIRNGKWNLATGKQLLVLVGIPVKLFSPFPRISLYLYVFSYLQGFDMVM